MRPEFRTWRVRCIPLDFNEQQLSEALQTHPKLWVSDKRVLGAGDLGLDECDGNVIVKTLSTDIRSTHLVATVRFRHFPPPLLDSGDPLSIEISTISANLPAGSKRKQESCQIIIDDHFYDLTVLSSPRDVNHKVDVLAISGLGSHAYGSYVHKLDGHMWLSDSLSKDCPSARVVIYGYNSKLQGSESFEDLDGLASSFQIALSRLTTSSKHKKPLVIIGHSLGGLVIKQSLIRIANSDRESSLLDSVVGAMFLGVPNDGMDIECLIPMVNDQPNRFLLESINRNNSQVLRMQKLDFSKVLENSNIDLFCFYETLRSSTAAKNANGEYKMTGEQRCLVSQSSASSCLPQGASSDHTIPLSCAHSDLVKFSVNDAEYDKVLHTLTGLCRRVLQRVAPNADAYNHDKWHHYAAATAAAYAKGLLQAISANSQDSTPHPKIHSASTTQADIISKSLPLSLAVTSTSTPPIPSSPAITSLTTLGIGAVIGGLSTFFLGSNERSTSSAYEARRGGYENSRTREMSFARDRERQRSNNYENSKTREESFARERERAEKDPGFIVDRG